jgi:endonuclease YncB( thermonuclease family)
MRLILPLLLAVLLLGATDAHAAFKAPCRPGNPGGAKCTYWRAKVNAVDDGDTLKVHVLGAGNGKERVRVTGMNAPELTHYSHTPSERRGPCHGTEAAAFVDAALRGTGHMVRLAAQRKSSHSGVRIRRTVWLKKDGVWRDLAQMELRAGLALWLPNTVEWAHNRQYEKLASAAILAKRGIYNPSACAAGPDDDLPISLRVNWDANGNDDHNLLGEYVDVRNGGDRDLSLTGWFFRDSALRRARNGVYGYPFPAGATVPAHSTVRLRVGCGDNDPSHFFWCQTETVFENVNHRKGSGDGGYLFDGDGDLRAARIYPCMLRCVDPPKGKLLLRVHPRPPEAITIFNRSGEDLALADHVLKLNYQAKVDQYVFGRTFPAPSVLGAGDTFTYRPARKKSIPNHGGVVELRSDDDILTACGDWGFGRCGRAPKRRKHRSA